MKGFIWPWVVSSVVEESYEDDYELSDYIKNNKNEYATISFLK